MKIKQVFSTGIHLSTRQTVTFLKEPPDAIIAFRGPAYIKTFPLDPWLFIHHIRTLLAFV